MDSIFRSNSEERGSAPQAVIRPRPTDLFQLALMFGLTWIRNLPRVSGRTGFMIPMTGSGNVGTIGGWLIYTPRLNTTTISLASIGLTHLRLRLGDLIPLSSSNTGLRSLC